MSGAVELGRVWRRFLDAVEAGDAAAIGSCVSEEVTMFVPFNSTRDAVQGRAAVVALFGRVFAGAQRGPAIAIERFDCRELGPGSWFAESMVRLGNEWGRRTLLFCEQAGEWRIAHMHASNVVAVPSRLPFALG